MYSKKGRCAICQRFGDLITDHDHDTNKIRGRLCGKCNTGLGMFRDKIDVLISAVIYLQTFKGIPEEKKANYQNRPSREPYEVRLKDLVVRRAANRLNTKYGALKKALQTIENKGVISPST